MSCYGQFGFLVLLVGIPASDAYGGGAPTRACRHMSPIHTGVVVQQNVSPYTLNVNTDFATAGETLRVCVTGKAFAGILLQMRVVNDTTPVGTFNGTPGTLANNTKLIACSANGDTVTHSKPTPKANGTCFIWKAPEDKVPDILHFVATIAENKDTYWVNVTSDIINTPPITTASRFAESTPNTKDTIAKITMSNSGAFARECYVCGLYGGNMRLETECGEQWTKETEVCPIGSNCWIYKITVGTNVTYARGCYNETDCLNNAMEQCATVGSTELCKKCCTTSLCNNEKQGLNNDASRAELYVSTLAMAVAAFLFL